MGDGNDKSRESIKMNIDKYEALLMKAGITEIKEVSTNMLPCLLVHTIRLV